MGFIKTRYGADGRSRTGTAYATRPSSVRVYQFHHVGYFMLFVTPLQMIQNISINSMIENNIIELIEIF